MSARRWRVRQRPEVNTPEHSAVRSRSMVVSMISLSFMEMELSPVTVDVAKPQIIISVIVVTMMISFMEVKVSPVKLK